MTFLRRLAVALLLMMSPPLGALAQDLPQPASDTLSDFAAVLDASEEGRISRALAALRAETGVHMVVVTLPGLDGHGGAGLRLESYGKALFNAWGVGDASRNDGIMLLLDITSREARIVLGAGYDPVYDGRAARVLTTAVLPELRQGRLAAGIEAGIVSVRERLITPFQAGAPVGLDDGFVSDEGGSGLPVLGGVALAIAAAFLWLRRKLRAHRTCPKCGSQRLDARREVLRPATRAEEGLGLMHRACGDCGFNERHTYAIAFVAGALATEAGAFSHGHSSSSGSDSGGFGGGHSDGGGASGSW